MPAMTNVEFGEILERYGHPLEVSAVSPETRENDGIVMQYTAPFESTINPENVLGIYFTHFKSKDFARAYFGDMKSMLTGSFETGEEGESVNFANGESYHFVGGTYFFLLTYIDDTSVLATVETDQEKEVKEILEKTGYWIE
jgi:hypothetical protein